MADRGLRLVHNADISVRADGERAQWRPENVEQFGFFDTFDRAKIYLIPVWETSGHLFRKLLDKTDPRLVIKTGLYPKFFMVFNFLKAALKEFGERNVNYKHIPPFKSNNSEENWSKWLAEKSLLAEFNEQENGYSALFLINSWHIHDRIFINICDYMRLELENYKFQIHRADSLECDLKPMRFRPRESDYSPKGSGNTTAKTEVKLKIVHAGNSTFDSPTGQDH